MSDTFDSDNRIQSASVALTITLAPAFVLPSTFDALAATPVLDRLLALAFLAHVAAAPTVCRVLLSLYISLLADACAVNESLSAVAIDREALINQTFWGDHPALYTHLCVTFFAYEHDGNHHPANGLTKAQVREGVNQMSDDKLFFFIA